MSWRSLSVKHALQIMMPHQHLLGISRLANLSPFVDLKVHVVQAVRTNLVRGQVSATTGKGWRLMEALCGAYGEALERHCAAHPLPQHIVALSETDLDCASLDCFGHPPDFAPKIWFVAQDLLHNHRCLLPALEVCFPYHGADLKQTTIRPNTSGLACGATTAEAALFGLFEVVERHASSRFFQQYKQKPTGALIAPDSITNPRIQQALQNLRKQGYEFFIFRLEAILPTYYMAIFDTTNLGPKFMVAGLGCSISETKALDGAVLEALQAIVIATQGAREDLSRMTSLYNKQQVGQTSPFYRIRHILSEMNPERNFCDTGDGMGSSTEHALQQVLEQLKQRGVTEIYQCNLSQPQLPLSVVKIIVPGMFDSHINPSRGGNVIAAA